MSDDDYRARLSRPAAAALPTLLELFKGELLSVDDVAAAADIDPWVAVGAVGDLERMGLVSGANAATGTLYAITPLGGHVLAGREPWPTLPEQPLDPPSHPLQRSQEQLPRAGEQPDVEVTREPGPTLSDEERWTVDTVRNAVDVRKAGIVPAAFVSDLLAIIDRLTGEQQS